MYRGKQALISEYILMSGEKQDYGSSNIVNTIKKKYLSIKVYNNRKLKKNINVTE